jgi:uncharacterized spore protein YtfJ
LTTQDVLKETALALQNMLSSNNVIGAPMDLGDKIVIPLTQFGFGFGAGGAHMNQAGGEGSGAGGGINPIALIIVQKDVSGLDGIKVLSLHWNPVSQVIETISESLAPKVIDGIKVMTGAPKEKKGEE